MDDAATQVDEKKFADALKALASASKSFRNAIEVAATDNDSLMSAWVGESAASHSQRWSSFISAAGKLADELELDHARLSQVIESVTYTDTANATHSVSLLDLS